MILFVLLRIGIVFLIYFSAKARATGPMFVALFLLLWTYAESILTFRDEPLLHLSWIWFASILLASIVKGIVLAVRSVRDDR